MNESNILLQHAEWYAARLKQFPLIRLKAIDPADECESPVWLDGEMFAHIPQDQRWSPPVKRGPGRPRKHPLKPQ